MKKDRTEDISFSSSKKFFYALRITYLKSSMMS
jgi:hypothetical protein